MLPGALASGFIDQPERFYGLRYSGKPNLAALALACDRTTGTHLQKQFFKRRLLKAVEKYGMEGLKPEFRYRYLLARLYLGDFSDYWGLEYRSRGEPGDAGAWSESLYWMRNGLAQWNGENIRRLVVMGEQGLGDQVFQASILPEAMLRAQEVVFECDMRLHSLLERSLKGLRCAAQRLTTDDRSDYGPVDAFIPGMDLMRMFRRRKADFPGKPFLKPDPERVAQCGAFLGRIGIAWRGRQGAVDPSAFHVERPVCLQYGANDEHAWIERTGIDVRDDIEGLAALVSVLKAVATVPQTVHHFAAALGVPTHIVLPDIPGETQNDIRWDCSPEIDAGRLPWYGSARVHGSMKEVNRALEAQ